MNSETFNFFFILFAVERTCSDWRKRVGSRITKCHPQYSYQRMLRYIIHGKNPKDDVDFYCKTLKRDLYESHETPRKAPHSLDKISIFISLRRRNWVSWNSDVRPEPEFYLFTGGPWGTWKKFLPPFFLKEWEILWKMAFSYLIFGCKSRKVWK